jgi:hypothetical protein
MRPNKATKLFRLQGIFWTGIICFSASLLQAQLINVDFNENDGVGWGGGGPNPGPTMSGAAVLGKAGDQWNGITVSNGSGISLVNADGSASVVKMTFTSGGGYDVNSFGGSTPFANTPYDALMEDYLYNGGTNRTITLSGLAANSVYDLVLYNAANSGAAGRMTSFTVNGITESSVWNGSSSTLIAGVDYAEFKSALSDGNGNLAITYNGNGSVEGDVNGFQIKAAPLKLSASYNGLNVSVSFWTQSGLSYQMQYKTNLTDAAWSPLGGAIAGSNAVSSVSDASNGSSRFYRVQVTINSGLASIWWTVLG